MNLLRKSEDSKSSLRRKMIFYFFLIAVANIFVTFEFILDLGSQNYRQKISQEITLIKDGSKDISSFHEQTDRIVKKLTVMLAILVIISAVVLYLFVTQIASPIQYMINKASQIAEGDLSTTIQIKSNDEIASLGNLINDLTANLQEIIAQLQQIHPGLEQTCENMQEKLALFPELAIVFQDDIEKLQAVSSDLHILKEAFTLYQIQQTRENTGEEG